MSQLTEFKLRIYSTIYMYMLILLVTFWNYCTHHVDCVLWLFILTQATVRLLQGQIIFQTVQESRNSFCCGRDSVLAVIIVYLLSLHSHPDRRKRSCLSSRSGLAPMRTWHAFGLVYKLGHDDDVGDGAPQCLRVSRTVMSSKVSKLRLHKRCARGL